MLLLYQNKEKGDLNLHNNSRKDRKQRLEDPLQPKEKEDTTSKLPIGKFFVILLAIFVIYGITSNIFGYEIVFLDQLFQWITEDLFRRGGGSDSLN